MTQTGLFALENVHRAWLACRRRKRGRQSALEFEWHQEERLLALTEALQSRTWRPAPFVCFVARRPKLREIFAAPFEDRIVHHLLIGHLEPRIDPRFIHDSYACRPGRGVHAGVDRLQGFLRSAVGDGRRPAHYLQLDIRNVFPSIDRARLWALLEPHLRHPDARWLAELLVFQDPTAGYQYRGPVGLHAALPQGKSLLHARPGCGLPIGNLTSQFFANVYLDRLDQFVKHRLKARWYLRYCDDFVLVHRSRAQLQDWQAQIAEFLHERLALELNPRRTRLRPVEDGVDFLGYVVRPHYRLVRRRVVAACHRALAGWARETRTGAALPWPGVPGLMVEAWAARTDVERLRARLASYLGHFAHADARRLTRSLWRRYPWLGRWFTPGRAPQPTLLARWPDPRRLRGFRAQQRALTQAALPCAAVFRVGRYLEAYGATARLLEAAGFRRRQIRCGLTGVGASGRATGRLLWLAASRPQGVVVLDEEAGRRDRPLMRWPQTRMGRR